MEILSKRMRKLRKERRLRQDEMAQFLSVSLSAYRRYELNDREPTVNFLERFADFFEVSADYLLGRTDIREVNKV